MRPGLSFRVTAASIFPTPSGASPVSSMRPSSLPDALKPYGLSTVMACISRRRESSIGNPSREMTRIAE